MRDLIAYVADKAMQQVLGAILDRPHALGIRPIAPSAHQIAVADGYFDSGVFQRGHEVLQAQSGAYAHALLVCDRHGCGSEKRSRIELEAIMEEKLSRTGWAQRGAAIVIDPELENWAWSRSPHVASALHWEPARLQDWLRDQGHWPEGAIKPARPKEVMDLALREVRQRRSNAVLLQIAEKASLERCSDPAFIKLRDTLRTWFPPTQ